MHPLTLMRMDEDEMRRQQQQQIVQFSDEWPKWSWWIGLRQWSSLIMTSVNSLAPTFDLFIAQNIR